ncbi:MAG TPA: hypothetical protein VGG74_36205 [Kofleriaceae bacterium]
MHRQARGAQDRRLRRAGAVATALLALTCMLVVQSSEAAVVHVRCAEHGVLMHLHPGAAPATAQSSGATALHSHKDDRVGHHDHCLMVATSHFVQASVAGTACTTASALELVRPPIPVEHVARATFRIAPKTSPPV